MYRTTLPLRRLKVSVRPLLYPARTADSAERRSVFLSDQPTLRSTLPSCTTPLFNDPNMHKPLVGTATRRRLDAFRKGDSEIQSALSLWSTSTSTHESTQGLSGQLDSTLDNISDGSSDSISNSLPDNRDDVTALAQREVEQVQRWERQDERVDQMQLPDVRILTVRRTTVVEYSIHSVNA